jgi:hypothetical protein
MGQAIWRRIQSEPALFYGLVNAIMTALVTFGLSLTVDQIGAVLLVTNALLAFATRQQVVPMVTHEAQVQEALYKEKPDQPDLTLPLPPPMGNADVSEAQGEEKKDDMSPTT